MVPCFHQGNIYSKRKQRVLRDQKCHPLVGVKTILTCADRQTTTSRGRRIGPRMESCVKWGGPIAMVPCLHLSNIYTKRKLRVWREQKCIKLVGAKSIHTCADRQTTQSRGRRHRAKTGKWSKTGGDLSPWYRVCTKELFILNGSYGYGGTRNVFQ